MTSSRPHARRLGVLVALAGAFLTACTGFGGSAEAPVGNAGADYQLVTAGELTFALSGQLKPFSFYDGGELTGFDHEVGMELAKRLGLRGKGVAAPFNSLLAGLQSGRYDAIVGSMTRTDQRAEVVDFTQDYYESGAYLWVSTDSRLNGVGDLSSATVGVVLGSTFEEWARKQPSITEVKTYQTDVDAITDVQSGRVDAAVADRLVGSNAVAETGLRVRAVGEALLDNSAAIPVRKGNKALLDALNGAIDDMRADGTYARIFTRWFGANALSSATPTSPGR